LIFLSEADVSAVLSVADAIDAVGSALKLQASGAVNQPLRVGARSPAGILGAMPCAIAGVGSGAKLVTFFPGNAVLGMPTHNAIIALVDPDTGVPTAVMDGRYITEIRTAATSAVATRALAKEGARVVAMLGTGVQARAHALALREVGRLEELRVWGRTARRAEEYVDWARQQGIRASVATSVSAAARGADIVCTVTSAQAPILDASDVGAGTHVNAVGSSAPHMRELTPALLAKARIVVDTVEGAMNESGEIIDAVRQGVLPPKPDLTRLCDVIAGSSPGRSSPAEVTVFKSLGMAIEDVACAAVVESRARNRKLGTQVAL
jgi:alanine dehydrogenase